MRSSMTVVGTAVLAVSTAVAGLTRASYAGARTATLIAARVLYGAGSSQDNAVAAAWSAVSVS